MAGKFLKAAAGKLKGKGGGKKGGPAAGKKVYRGGIFLKGAAGKGGEKKPGKLVGALTQTARKKSTAGYKPGNVRKGAKAGPGRRPGFKPVGSGSSGGTDRISHLSPARQKMIRNRRNS